MTESPVEGVKAATPKRRNLKRLGLVGVGLGIGLMLAPATVDAAVNYFDTTITVKGTSVANCPAGTRLTGGGARLTELGYLDYKDSVEFELTSSYPSGNSWRGTALKKTGRLTNTGWSYGSHLANPEVHAICTK